jgi:glucose-1-phosphate cytidylyltransferase
LKVVILAGGLGTRLSTQKTIKPKPMVEIGNHPVLWHIMKYFAANGFTEFVIALGYKSWVIKEYFLNYHFRTASLSLNLADGNVSLHHPATDNWTIHLLETGQDDMTGSRIRQAAQFIGPEPFLLTYGDGLSNVNLSDLIKFHRTEGKIATVTAVHPVARFGEISIKDNKVTLFEEKPQVRSGWINGGFFVLEPEVIEFISPSRDTVWEQEPMKQLAANNQLAAFQHDGFWQCMDTARDVRLLEKIWQDNAPWKVWQDD